MAAKSGWVVLCAWVITTLLALTSVIKGTQAKQEFDELTVRRINVVEPDGTLRMVISNHDALPRDGQGNRQGQNQRPGGGILFHNDEGTVVGEGEVATAGDLGWETVRR